jgi:hypothetical protein
VTAGLSVDIPAGLDRLLQEFPKVSKLLFIDLTEQPRRPDFPNRRTSAAGAAIFRARHLDVPGDPAACRTLLVTNAPGISKATPTAR